MELPRGRVLRQLCRQGNVEMVKRMLEAGVPVDAPQEDGCTGLWLAAEAGCADVVKLLAEAAGASVNAVKTAGNISALYVAAQNGHQNVLDVLLVNGANPNIAKSTGATPLFIAAQQNYSEIVSSLLKAGCNPNSPTQQGVTPLMIAAFQGNNEVARKMLQGGADANLVGQGKTALDWARSNNHQTEFQRVLDDHLRDMEAEVRRRQQLLAKTGAGVQRGSPQRGDTQSQVGGVGGGGQSEVSSESGVTYAGGRTAPSNRSSASVLSGGKSLTSMSALSPHEKEVLHAQEEAAELPWAIQDAAATLAQMDLQSRYLIPEIAKAASQTPGGRAMTPGGYSHAGGGSPGRSRTPGRQAAARTSSFYNHPMASGAGRMDRSLGQYGGMTTATISEEERRSSDFRKMVKRDNTSSGKDGNGITSLMSPNGKISRQSLYNVEQQWESHRDRVGALISHGEENADVLGRQLNQSRDANSAYALRAMELTPAFRTVRQNAADQRAQSEAQHKSSPQKTSGFNFPRLPSKKLSALHTFMAQGRDAKGPPGTDGAAAGGAGDNIQPPKKVGFEL